MKIVYKIITILLMLFFGFPYTNAQTADLLPEASRALITKIEHEKFTFTLERFEDEGVHNLSMSKGFEFIRIGSDLQTILNTLWPKTPFVISAVIQKHKYHLMLQHLDQKRTDEFLETVLDEYLAHSGFNIIQRQENQFQFCVEVMPIEKLTDHLFVPDKGVIRSTTYMGDELILSGFNLEDILAELSNISGSKFSMDKSNFADQTYKMSFNVKNLNTIKESLKIYGLSSDGCEKEVEVVYIE